MNKRLDPKADVTVDDYCISGNGEMWKDYIPDHTRKAIEDYLLRGYEPGSFVTGLLANDMFRAVGSMDHINEKNLKHITTWVVNVLPHGCFGNYERIQNWIHDKDECRSMFIENVEKKMMWRVLNANRT
jgi:hypothetical protein